MLSFIEGWPYLRGCMACTKRVYLGLGEMAFIAGCTSSRQVCAFMRDSTVDYCEDNFPSHELRTKRPVLIPKVPTYSL